MATTAQPTELAREGWDDFLELETRIQQVAEALQKTRAERDRALTELRALQASQEKLRHGQTEQEQELVALRKERNEVRQRLGRLSKLLEAAEG